jgi:hypothetical protein
VALITKTLVAMDSKWKDEALSLLKAGASLDTYHKMLVRMKDEEISAAKAEKLFIEIRGIMTSEGNEEGEDRVLEVLDFVTGWCSPHNRVW